MRYRVVSACLAAVAVAGLVVTTAHTRVTPAGLDLSAANRRAPLPGLPDWHTAGYRGGQNLPGEAEHTTDAACRITPEELASTFIVKPDDGVDDSPLEYDLPIDSTSDGSAPILGVTGLGTPTGCTVNGSPC